eukprot:4054889-Prorocentrum_lima.AAC.1
MSASKASWLDGVEDILCDLAEDGCALNGVDCIDPDVVDSFPEDGPLQIGALLRAKVGRELLEQG